MMVDNKVVNKGREFDNCSRNKAEAITGILHTTSDTQFCPKMRNRGTQSVVHTHLHDPRYLYLYSA